MKDVSQTSRLSQQQVDAILEAAAPIPQGTIKEFDLSDDGKLRQMPISLAIVKRLEGIHAVTQMYLDNKDDMSASDLRKRFLAIASAAKALIEALGLNADDEADLKRMPRKIRHALGL